VTGWRRATFVVLEVLVLLAIPVAGVTGFRAVLDTTDGQVVDPVLDPTEPGYEASVVPTPVELVELLDDAGGLDSLAVLVLSGTDEAGGTVLFVPIDSVVNIAFVEQPGTIREAYATDPALVPVTVGRLLSLAFNGVDVLSPERLAALVAPAAPLAVANSDEIPGFATGDLDLAADEVPAFLAARADGESDLARLARHEALWRSWLGAVAASTDPGIVPGETATGIGRFVRGLAAGPVDFQVIPVSEQDGTFTPDLGATRALVNEVVPFPIGFDPGIRPRLRVLDGIGSAGLAVRVARDAIVATDVVVTVIGNADQFGRPASEVVYFDDRFASAAADVAAALGIATVRQDPGPNPDDQIDLTVLVGSDLAGAYGVGPSDTGGDTG
jgi:hypothetical protein